MIKQNTIEQSNKKAINLRYVLPLCRWEYGESHADVSSVPLCDECEWWGPLHLHDLHELLCTRRPAEERTAQRQLRRHTPERPLVDGRGVAVVMSE